MTDLRPYEVLCDGCGKPRNKFASRCPNCPTGVEVLYRYEDNLNEDEPRVYLRTFKVIRETPSVWFFERFPGAASYIANGTHDRSHYERRAYKDSRVSFAYPTIELARKSFTIRKKKQLGYLSRQHDHVAAIVARLSAGTAWDPLPESSAFEGLSL